MIKNIKYASICNSRNIDITYAGIDKIEFVVTNKYKSVFQNISREDEVIFNC